MPYCESTLHADILPQKLSRRPAMVRELRALAEARSSQGGEPITLARFLEESGLDLPDVYKAGCWSGLKRDAGLAVALAGPEEEKLGGALERLLHLDDPRMVGGDSEVFQAEIVVVLPPDREGRARDLEFSCAALRRLHEERG